MKRGTCLETDRQPPCADFGRAGSGSKIGPLLSSRLLAVAMDPTHIKNAGAALPLLFAVIRRCGEANSFVAPYANLASECQVSPATVKSWGASLERGGFIEKELTGPSGIRITLNPDRLGPLQWEDPNLCRIGEDRRVLRAATDTLLHLMGEVDDRLAAHEGTQT